MGITVKLLKDNQHFGKKGDVLRLKKNEIAGLILRTKDGLENIYDFGVTPDYDFVEEGKRKRGLFEVVEELKELCV